MLRGIRGWKALIHDAVDLTVDLVAEGHESVGRNAMRVLRQIEPLAVPAERINTLRQVSTELALGSVRRANRALERLTDLGLDAAIAPSLGDHPPPAITMRSDIVGGAEWLADAALGAVNGALGDHLHRANNPLDLGFSLRYRDSYAPTPPLPRRIAVFVHGLGTTEWSWCYGALTAHGDAAQCFGTLLEHDVGLAPLFARYNTGRRVFENGQLLADVLERLFAEQELDQVVLVGHSMGGLVVRSACHYASESGQRWVKRVSHVIALGTPHRGAPLEQAAELATAALSSIDLPGARIPAEILRRRSAGVRDLARGSILDGDAPPTLLEHAQYYFVSATITENPRHPLGWLVGDVMVRVPSASGPERFEPVKHFESPCLGGMAHQELQNHPEVYAVLRTALRRS